MHLCGAKDCPWDEFQLGDTQEFIAQLIHPVPWQMLSSKKVRQFLVQEHGQIVYPFFPYLWLVTICRVHSQGPLSQSTIVSLTWTIVWCKIRQWCHCTWIRDDSPIEGRERKWLLVFERFICVHSFFSKGHCGKQSQKGDPCCHPFLSIGHRSYPLPLLL